jgi:MinD-like ATPase involved in chromosome partitioning or flagellar assembly
MTADEHDKAAGSGVREATEIYPFSSGYPQQTPAARGPLPDWQAADQPLPDLPVMEQLPDPDALPDPGYPAMPATPPPVAAQPPARPPWPAPSCQAERSERFSSGKVELPPTPPRPPAPPEPTPEPTPEQASPPDAASWPRPAAYRRPEPPNRRPEPPYRRPEPRQSAQRPLDVQPTWTPDPYTAPRPPEAAPPLRGPSVPWSQVRVGGNVPMVPPPEMAPPEMAPPEMAPPEIAPSGIAPSEIAPSEIAPLGTPPPGTTAPGITPTGTRTPGIAPWEMTPPPGPPEQRQTADTLTSDLLLPGKRATPDGGWRRTVYRATGGLVRVGESAASLQRRDLVSRVRAPVAGGHHRVAVLSLKGGVGKTTVTVGLGSTLASLRGDRVIAVDGNPDRGTLSDKVRLETSATIRDLLNERSMVTRYADVRAYTSQAPSRLEILASDRDPGVSVAFSADDYRTVVGVLEHYYSICITDCGTGLLHSAMAGILELADQMVLVSSPSVDGARSASATLDWLEAHGYEDLVSGGVVVLSAIRRKSKSTVDLDRLEQHFAARSRAVVRVPYDPHLEEGAEVELEMLNEETADAYLALAALVADGFAHPRRSSANTTSGSPFA